MSETGLPSFPPRPQRLPRHVYYRRRAVVGGLAAAGAVNLARRVAGFFAPEQVLALERSPVVTTTTTTAPPTTTTAAPAPAPPVDTRNPIQKENALRGDSDFGFPFLPHVYDPIDAYASIDSAVAGDVVTLYVSSSHSIWRAELYRMGWYGGAGARKVWDSGVHKGEVQTATAFTPGWNLTECRWRPSVQLVVDPGWTTGIYLFKFETDAGGHTYVPLVIRDPSPRQAQMLVVSSNTTWQAYNEWGGSSLYKGPFGRARVVSFDRPYQKHGSGHFFGGEYEFIQQVESQGHDVRYCTDIDLHRFPGIARSARCVVSMAHDEYYSREMRAELERARDAGVNLLFLGANAVFRRIRLDKSPAGVGQRWMVNHRDPALDPMSAFDPTQVTSSWRSGPAANPESTLVGNFYESNPVLADMVIADADSWIFARTGLRNGDRLPALVQNEYDRVTPEVPTPTNIQVLCHSPLECRGKKSFADVTYYTHQGSGAGVFATGTLWWERQLGPLCHDGPGEHSLQCRVRRITQNILDVFVQGPAARLHPSESNLSALGIHPGYIPDPPR